MSNQTELISLYDYLGKAAGPELGKLVADYAKLRKFPVQLREVNTKTYKGKVLLYTKEFLMEFFHAKNIFTYAK